jgi:hypothetical protein
MDGSMRYEVGKTPASRSRTRVRVARAKARATWWNVFEAISSASGGDGILVPRAAFPPPIFLKIFLATRRVIR